MVKISSEVLADFNKVHAFEIMEINIKNRDAY